MQRKRYIAGALCLCAVSVICWKWSQGNDDPTVSGSETVSATVTSGSTFTGGQADSHNESTEVANSPFTVSTKSADVASESPTIATGERAVVGRVADAQSRADSQRDQEYDSLDVRELGRTAIADEVFDQWADRLKDKPALLQQLIDEFRQETDPERRERLSRLLSEVGGAEVTLAASELIYSSDPQSRRLGLAMLQKVQPGNEEARSIASSLLVTETEPAVLVDTLTSLATPGVVDDETRQSLASQVAVLANHSDASVRSVSLNILSRWSTDGTFTELLLNGLQDEEAIVRETAVYALVGHEDPSQSVINNLLAIATTSNEADRARRGAILALRGMPITDSQRQLLVDTERALDTVRR